MRKSVDEIRRNIEIARSQRADNRDRVFSGLPTDSAVEGTFLVDGSGEAQKAVNFPISFIARPSIQFGYELHIDTSPTGGSFPIPGAVIHRWITNPPIPENGAAVDLSKIYFVGAHLLITTTGPVGQRIWVHWRASGRALVNPGPDTGTTTESIL